MHTRRYHCVCPTTWHPVRHKPSSIWGIKTLPFERRISPIQKFFKSSLAQSIAFESTPTPAPPPPKFNLATPNAHQMISLCLCNNMTLILTEALLKTDWSLTPLGHVLWNSKWFLSIPGGYLVKIWGWLVLKREIFIFTLKAPRPYANYAHKDCQQWAGLDSRLQTTRFSGRNK